MGIVGLGIANMVRRLVRGGHECVVFDSSPDAVQGLVREKALGAASLQELSRELRNMRRAFGGHEEKRA
jgi:6-phosphogluconate dehydrogenase